MSSNGMDPSYISLFRIDDAHPEHDKLALLACSRQGLTPDELLFKPVETFQERGLPQDKATLRFEMAEKRRQAKIKLVADERSALLLQLFQKSGVASQQEPGAPNEASLPSQSLREMDVLNGIKRPPHSAPPMGPSRILSDVEKMRAREMKQVEQELAVEMQREETLAAIEAKNQRDLQVQQQKRLLQQMRSDEKQRAANNKLQRLAEHRLQKEEAQRQKLDEADAQARERERRRQEEFEASRQARNDSSSSKLGKVSERNRLVQESILNRSQMQLQEMAHKQQLHYERRKNIQLHQETLKEVNKIKHLQKAVAIHEAAEMRMEEEEIWKSQLLEKQEQASDRVAQQKAEIEAMNKERRMQQFTKAQRRLELKQGHDLKYKEQTDRVLLKHHKKDHHLAAMKTRAQEERELHLEHKIFRIQNWVDNKARLNRMEEYRKSIKQAKIDADRSRTDQLIEERRMITEERQRHKKAAQLEKEKLLKEVEKLRCSADPQSLLKSSALRSSHSQSDSKRRPLSSSITQDELQAEAPPPAREGSASLAASHLSLSADAPDKSAADQGSMASDGSEPKPPDEYDDPDEFEKEKEKDEGGQESSPNMSMSLNASAYILQMDAMEASVADLSASQPPPEPQTKSQTPSSTHSFVGDELGGGRRGPTVSQLYLSPQKRAHRVSKRLKRPVTAL
eukprot:NODE_540_length_2101_cov_21.853597_g500_i0.p1 GENE.NODE_540_length_2101_cov_21.853597_g500_i0~~NODE_540_length_2101_cov_21.853597_g500_i0.p1  ORF type:complete len:682 (-),score=200.33 NODE_540_length_2101_cov_21.853597_g500_i0:38-2083(-)